MKSNIQYICQSCGSVYMKWTGKCEQCNEWNSLIEESNSKQPGLWPSPKGKLLIFKL